MFRYYHYFYKNIYIYLYIFIYLFSRYKILFKQNFLWTKEKSTNLLFFIYQKMIINIKNIVMALCIH